MTEREKGEGGGTEGRRGGRSEMGGEGGGGVEVGGRRGGCHGPTTKLPSRGRRQLRDFPTIVFSVLLLVRPERH